MATVGRLNIILGAKVGKFLSGMRKVDEKLQNVTSSAKFQGALTLAFAGVTAAIIGSTKAFASFERQAVRVGAITGELQKFGDAGIGRIQEEILSLSKTTEFTASQVGEAFGFMAQSGLAMVDVIGAAPGVLQLASAAMIGVARAADIATNVMKGFGLEVNELQRVNDVLIKTATKSNTSVTQLGDALKFVGPVAESAGVEIEEVAAAIGILGDAGLQGELGGTALRGAMSKILAPTKEAQKIMKGLGINIEATTFKAKDGLAKVLEKLGPLAGKTGEIFKIFGQRAGPGVAVLLKRGADSLRDFTDTLRRSAGTAREIAEAQLKTLDGRIKILKSNFEASAIAIGKSFVPAMEELIPVVTKAAVVIGDFFKFLSFSEDAERPIDKITEKIATQAKVVQNLERTMREAQMSNFTGDNDARIFKLIRRIQAANRKLNEFRAEGGQVVKSLNIVADTGDAAGNAMEEAASKAKKLFDQLKRIRDASELKLELSFVQGGLARQVAGVGFGLQNQRQDITEKAGGSSARQKLATEAIENLELATSNTVHEMIAGAKTLSDFNAAMKAAEETGIGIGETNKLLAIRAGLVAKAFSETPKALRENTSESIASIREIIEAFKKTPKALVENVDQTQKAGRGFVQTLKSSTTELAGLGGSIAGTVVGLFEKVFSAMQAAVITTGGAIKGAISSAVGATGESRISGATSGALNPAILGGGAAIPVFMAALSATSAVLLAGLPAFSVFVAALGPIATLMVIIQSPLVAMVLLITAVVARLTIFVALLAVALGGFFMLTAGLLLLAKETEAFQRIQSAMAASVDRLVKVLEPVAEKGMALVGLFDAFIGVLIPFAESVLSSEQATRLLFQVFKFLAIVAAGLSIIFAAVGDIFLVVASAVLGTTASLMRATSNVFETVFDGMLSGVILMLQGLSAFSKVFSKKAGDAVDDLADKVGKFQAEDNAAQFADSLDNAGLAAQEMRPDLVGMGEALNELIGLSFEEATARGENLASMKEMTESLSNVPEGFAVARERLAAIIPGLGNAPVPNETGAIDGQGLGNVIIGSVTVITEDPEEFVRILREQAEQGNSEQTGSGRGQQFNNGGGM